MTETQLLQMRLDVLSAAGSAVKPVPHHVIADHLASTESRELVRYNLRVIDALVDTGELVRHINVEGGRNTYSLGTLNAGDSKRRLRQLFADDLEGAADAGSASPEPLPMARGKEARPQGQAAGMANVTHIKPGAKPEPYRPTEPVRARVLGLIDETRQCTRAYLVSRLHDVTTGNVDNALWVLCKSGLLVKIGAGEYTRPEGASPAAAGTSVAPKAAPPALKPAARARAVKGTAQPSADPVAPAAPALEGRSEDGALTSSAAVPNEDPLATALTHATQAMALLSMEARRLAAAASAPKPVTDLDTKVAVLRKLAPMVAADISAVLDAVANDLQTMAVAA